MQSPSFLYGIDLSHEAMQEYVKSVTAILRRFPRDVGLVFRGISGMVVGIRVADRTKRLYSIIRKEGEKRHSNSNIEGWIPKKYVIIDDFISSGKTIKAIVAAMDQTNKRQKPKCLGVILYLASAGNDECYLDDGRVLPIFRSTARNSL